MFSPFPVLHFLVSDRFTISRLRTHWKRLQLAAQLRKLQIARANCLITPTVVLRSPHRLHCERAVRRRGYRARRRLSKHSEQLGIQDIDFILIRRFFPPPLSCRCLLGVAENDTTDQTKADLGSNACKSLLENKNKNRIMLDFP